MTDYCDLTAPGRSFALSGPDTGRPEPTLPVRGDLAHIALAGQVFVPHYAVPERYVTTGAAPLRKSARGDADVVTELAADTGFEVLDIAGGFAWGMVADEGPIGYVSADALARCA